MQRAAVLVVDSTTALVEETTALLEIARRIERPLIEWPDNLTCGSEVTLCPSRDVNAFNKALRTSPHIDRRMALKTTMSRAPQAPSRFGALGA
jgi:hypothetical protein